MLQVCQLNCFLIFLSLLRETLVGQVNVLSHESLTNGVTRVPSVSFFIARRKGQSPVQEFPFRKFYTTSSSDLWKSKEYISISYFFVKTPLNLRITGRFKNNIEDIGKKCSFAFRFFGKERFLLMPLW